MVFVLKKEITDACSYNLICYVIIIVSLIFIEDATGGPLEGGGRRVVIGLNDSQGGVVRGCHVYEES